MGVDAANRQLTSGRSVPTLLVMTPVECDQRLRFLGLTDQDADVLRSLRPLFQSHADRVLSSFYDHLFAFEETRALIQGHTTVERLKSLQYDYLRQLTEGRFDTAYFENRLRIGRTHERVGLSPTWYMCAYNHFFGLLASVIREHHRDDVDAQYRALGALGKVFALDASLAMEAYMASDRYRHLRQLESIVADSADAIVMLDHEKRFRTWNRAADRTFGWKASEILGCHLDTIVPEDLRHGGESDRIDRELADHGYCHLQTERLARDGSRVPVDLTISLLSDPQGRPIGRSAILRDITSRKQQEEARLQTERLAVIGAMSAKLAHEIRNPLSSITLNIDLVRDEIDALSQHDPAKSQEARALLKSISAEVRRIQRVVEDYLQFARLPRLRREQVSVNEILLQGLGFLQSLFDACHVTVNTSLEQSLPPLHADESQLWQAVLNLIRNALDAMPSGGSLSISTRREADMVVIRIADTGKGMDEREQQQLFKPFFSTKTGGTGLGLPLTQQIVSEHGGFIRCHTQPGVGTTFAIHLKYGMESTHEQTR